MIIGKKEQERLEREQCAQISLLCRQKLMGYAESFEELGKSFRQEIQITGEDRQNILEKCMLWQSRPERNRSRNSVSTLRRKLMWKRWRRISWDWYTKVRSFFRKTIKQGNCFSTVNLLFLSQKMKSFPPSI